MSAVEGMLRAAGAREPWAHPERLQDVPGTLATIATISAGLPDLDGIIGRLQRAQTAVGMLRRELPHLIEHAIVSLNAGPSLLGGEQAHAALPERVARLAALQNALFDVYPGSGNLLQRVLTNWHIPAMMLLVQFQSVVGNGSGSRHGPAARFVQLALQAVGHGKRSLPAIEDAIYTQQKTGRWKSDISG